ncbi:MAG: hypothetical protein CTY20_06965 [Hyphomicrobium sp.]|nr:MAG: hypothetical protein CTY20_06965 [Hyphomicrobium sp.]
MTVLRFFASLFLLVAIVAFVADLTPWLQGTRGFSATSFAKHWTDLAPATLQTAKQAMTKSLGAWSWDWLTGSLISLPTSMLFGLLALGCGYAGRRRRRVNVFVN